MAVMTVKATYSLDPETVRRLEELARRWGVSKSETMRRAIRSVAATDAEAGEPAIRALDALQRSLTLSPAKAEEWASAASSERRLASSRRERRRR